MLAKQLAIEFANDGILVNSYAPAALTQAMQSTVRNKDVLELDAVKSAKVELAANVPVYLLHPSCQVTGRSYYSGAGNVSAIAFGSAKGVTDRNLTLEKAKEIIDHQLHERHFQIHHTIASQMAHTPETFGYEV